MFNRKMKIGRNQPCWCGSGKKYKKCHLNRAEQEEIEPWEADQNLRKAFGAKYCSVPDALKYECRGNIVKAHSISKSMNLKRIERSGHVYAFVQNLKNLTSNYGVLHPILYGINKASTFTGFCAYHDKQMFSPLEDQEFIGSKKQCFLLAYRALTREYFTKQGFAKSIELMMQADRGKSLPEQLEIQDMVSALALGAEAGVRDVTIYKENFDAILTTKNFSNINAFLMNFKKTPSVLCSAAIYPECDFTGNHLQDLSDLNTTPDLLTFSTIATRNGGAVVFSWINDNESKGNCEKFINSLKAIAPENITSSLIRFFFESCENVFMEPAWWESLDKPKQESLCNRIASATSLLEERKPECLLSDKFIFDDWELINTQDIK